MKAMLSNNILTVKLKDGTLLTSTEGSRELYFKVIEMDDDEQVKKLLMGDLTPEEEAIVTHNEEVQVFKAEVQTVVDAGDFTKEGDDMYLKGVSISLPKVMVRKFLELQKKINSAAEKSSDVEAAEEEYEALKNFWRWNALNLNPTSREDLYKFVENNDVKVTPKGNMILYRRIVKAGEGSSELIEFITKEYVRVKKNKKSPAKFNVYITETEDGPSYILSGVDSRPLAESVIEGNLKELYDNLPNMNANLYTDNHTGKLVIQVGDVYRIEESEVDTNNGTSCSRGLHCASRRYNYNGFGDTPVMVLVNPSKVRAVPLYDNGKMRVVEMFIAAVLEIDHNGKYIDEDVNVLDLDDQYFNISFDELKELAANGATEEKGQGVLGVKELTMRSINNIIANFDDIKASLASRTVKLA